MSWDQTLISLSLWFLHATCMSDLVCYHFCDVDVWTYFCRLTWLNLLEESPKLHPRKHTHTHIDIMHSQALTFITKCLTITTTMNQTLKSILVPADSSSIFKALVLILLQIPGHTHICEHACRFSCEEHTDIFSFVFFHNLSIAQLKKNTISSL